MVEVPRALQLLQASVDQDDDSYIRLLVDGKHIKYITIAPGVFAPEDICFGPSITSLLPVMPTGDWNYGHILQDRQKNQPYFAQAVKRELKGIKNIWHPTKVDHLELFLGSKLRSGVYEATSSQFQATIIFKFARFEWEIDALDSECAAYQCIEGQLIGPKFLGHVSEEGRIIGFVMDKVSDARHPTVSDYASCAQTLTRLHQLGLLHGDLNKHNFLVNSTSTTLIDFECTRRSDDKQAFRAEFRNLFDQLNDVSGKGGSYTCSIQN